MDMMGYGRVLLLRIKFRVREGEKGPRVWRTWFELYGVVTGDVLPGAKSQKYAPLGNCAKRGQRSSGSLISPSSGAENLIS
jgi:hypothetical protein